MGKISCLLYFHLRVILTTGAQCFVFLQFDLRPYVAPFHERDRLP